MTVNAITTSDRRQSKTLLKIDEHGSKIIRNSVFDCHLSPVGRQMAIKISVSNHFLSMLVDSINVFNCGLSSVITDARKILCVQPYSKKYKLMNNYDKIMHFDALSCLEA